MAQQLAIGGMRISQVTSTDPHPLDAYVRALEAGSEDAFRSVYEMLVDDLASYAFGMVSDRRTAEDIVQQAFLELVRAAPRFRGKGPALRAWLFKSVRFGCLDEYRRRQRRPELPVDVVPDVPVEDDLLPDAIDPELERALASLNERHRSLVLLRHVVGLSGEEMARVMGSGVRATYAALARAEERLRVEMGEGA